MAIARKKEGVGRVAKTRDGDFEAGRARGVAFLESLCFVLFIDNETEER